MSSLPWKDGPLAYTKGQKDRRASMCVHNSMCICALPLPIEKHHSLILGHYVTSTEKAASPSVLISYCIPQIESGANFSLNRLLHTSRSGFMSLRVTHKHILPVSAASEVCSFCLLPLLCGSFLPGVHLTSTWQKIWMNLVIDTIWHLNPRKAFWVS